MSRRKVRVLIIDGLKMVLGSITVAFGFQYLCYPNNIVAGGVGGIAQIINMLIGWRVGLLIIAMNVPLFIWAWKKLGVRFLIGSLSAMLLSSLFIDLFASIPLEITNDPLLGAVYGGVVKGAGYGLIYTTGYTSGGIDIVARFLRNRYKHINFGTILLGLDVVEILAFALIFQKYDSCMYTMIAMFIIARVVNLVLYGAVNTNVCYIITGNGETLKKAIVERLHRGATVLRGEGAFTGREKTLILCVIKRHQIVDLKKVVSEFDNEAFVIVSESHEVFGKGFGDILADS